MAQANEYNLNSDNNEEKFKEKLTLILVRLNRIFGIILNN